MILEDAEAIYRNCAGLDVHKDTIKACVRKIDMNMKLYQQVRTFGTKTRELLQLYDWLAEHGVTHVAMESTGVYWKPVWNILEEGFKLILVNAKHLKQVPGRKTDVTDSEWIAKCMQLGLLEPSFVPERELRDLRDLTRHRTKLVESKGSVIQRIQKTLEDCNIKLGSVATKTMGVSGQEMIESLIRGNQDATQLADLARGRLRKKIPDLQLALEGRVTEHHRFMLKMLLQQLKSLESFIEKFNKRIEKAIRPYQKEIELFMTSTGVGRRTAENVVAECGTDMSRFPSDGHLCSWIGISPGNNESAGKHKSGKIKKGNRWAKKALTEAAWAASRTKGSYCQAQYRRIAARRGTKRAIVAVGHTLATAYFHIIRDKVPYKDLGPDHFLRLNPIKAAHYHIKKLEALGFKVNVEAA